MRSMWSLQNEENEKKNVNNIYKFKVLVKINLLKCDEDIYKNHSHVNGEIFSHVKTLKQ